MYFLLLFTTHHSEKSCESYWSYLPCSQLFIDLTCLRYSDDTYLSFQIHSPSFVILYPLNILIWIVCCCSVMIIHVWLAIPSIANIMLCKLSVCIFCCAFCSMISTSSSQLNSLVSWTIVFHSLLWCFFLSFSRFFEWVWCLFAPTSTF